MIIKTGGTIYPGMIELHNHLSRRGRFPNCFSIVINGEDMQTTARR
jgi:hypothetical protein